MRWYLSFWECVICGDRMIVLHPEGAGHTEECEGCGYEMQESEENRQVPEAFAKAEHERYGIPWEG